MGNRFRARWATVVVVAALAGSFGFRCSPVAFAEQADEAADAEWRETADRYWKVLSRRPRRGTAFDYWYRHWFDAGRGEELVEEVAARVREAPDDAAISTAHGLLLERVGDDAGALAAYENAARLAPNDYFVRLVLGELLVQVRRFDEAAGQFDAAAAAEIPRIELLDVFKRIGRAYARMGKRERSLATWQRLAEEFPEDRQVVEELAVLFAEEGQYAEALVQWRRLEALNRDHPAEATRIRIEMASTEARLGNVDAAVEQLDRLWDELEPESWLAKEVGRRIRTVLGGHDDSARLVEYYRERVARRPDDLASVLLLASSLVGLGRNDEALDIFQDALAKAPARRDIRMALIRALERMGRYEAAAEEAAAVVELDSDDADALELWGHLTLRAKLPVGRADAAAAAAEIFQRIAAARPEDANAAVVAADACVEAANIATFSSPINEEEFTGATMMPIVPEDDDEMTLDDDPLLLAAESLYREAVRRGPDDPEHYDYLGEFLHRRGRSEEAVATWRQMSKVDGGSAESMRGLAETLSQHGYLREGIEAAEEAVASAPNDFGMQDLLVRLLMKRRDFERAIAGLDRLDALARGAANEERAIDRRVDVYEAEDRLSERIGALRDRDERAVLDQWLLGLLEASDRQYDRAAASLQAAVAAAPGDARILKALASIHEQAGHLDEAVATRRKLVVVEPRLATHHFQMIVELQLSAGQHDAAEGTIETLIEQAPESPIGYQLRAEVARLQGDVEGGIEALRMGLRVAAADLYLRRRLAELLADAEQYDEALEQHWRCFELADSEREQLETVTLMASVAEEAGRFNALVDRLRKSGDGGGDLRHQTLCVVEAFRQHGDMEEALGELEGLLDRYPLDVALLGMCVQLAQRIEDAEAALRYQKRLSELAPTTANLERLARCYVDAGQEEQASVVWRRIVDETHDDAAILAAFDRSLNRMQFDDAKRLIDVGMARRDDDWRFVLRMARYAYVTGEDRAAEAAYRKIFELSATDEGVEEIESTPLRATGRWTPSEALRGAVPEIEDLAVARAARYQLPQFRRLSELHSQLSSMSQKARSQQMRIRAGRAAVALKIPQGLRAARIESMVHLLEIAKRANQDARWFAQQAESAGEDASWLTLLAVVAVSEERFHDAGWLLERLVEIRPADPVPHVLRICSFTESKRVALLSARERADELEGLRASFGWLQANHELLRMEMRTAYWNGLLSLGAVREVTAAVLEESEQTTDPETMVMLSDLASRTGDTDVQAAVFERAIALARAAGDRRHAKSLYEMLHQNFLFDDAEYYLDVVLRVFDAYLEITEPVSLAWSFGPADLGGAGGARQSKRPVDRFPEPTPYLDSDRLSVLSRVQRRLQAAGRIDLLVAHLEKQAAAHEATTKVSFELAVAYSEWWFGAQNDAVNRLSSLCDAHPADGTLWVIAAKATQSLVGPAAALELLNEAPEAASQSGAPVDRVRRELLEEVGRGDVSEAARGLEAELARRFGAPDLEPFLRGVALPRQIDIAGRTQTAEMVIANVSGVGSRRVHLTRSAARSKRWGLVELIQQAANDGRLERIAGMIEERVREFGEDGNLALVDAIVRLERRLGPEAAVERWATIAAGRPVADVGGAVRLIVGELLQVEGTRELGRRIGEEFFEASEAEHAAELAHALAVMLTRSQLAGGDVDAAQQWVDRLPGLARGDPTLQDEDGILRAERLADLARRAPPELAGVIVRALIAEAVRDQRSWQDPNDPIRPLVWALEGLGTRLALADREAICAALDALIWARIEAVQSLDVSRSSPWVALTRETVRMAASDEQLTTVRQRWDAPREADEETLDMLRLEGALGAGDTETALAILDRRVQQRPRDPDVLARRAAVHCELRSWDAAGADLDAALDLSRHLPKLWCERAKVHLAAGDEEAYAEMCREMVSVFGRRAMREPLLAEEIAWSCLLASGFESEASTILELAERAYTPQPGGWSAAMTAALARYRQGNYRGAFEAVSEGVVLAGARTPRRLALVAVLANQGLGQLDEAIRWYDGASNVEREGPADRDRGRRAHSAWWPDGWEAAHLREEAAQRLGLRAARVGD